MQKIKTTLLFLLIIPGVWAQTFDKQEQYEQAMQNARTALEANQYSDAVMFYREALKINPDAKLPRFKVEDIRTIYIENELDTLYQKKAEIDNNQKAFSFLGKKKKEEEKKELRQQAEEVGTVKMNKDAEKAKQELEELKIEAVPVNDEEDIEEEPMVVIDISVDRETGLASIQAREQKQIDSASKENTPELTAEKRETPKPKPAEETKTEEKPKPQPVKPVIKPPLNKKPVETMTPQEKKAWVEKENKRLAQQYPNQKTVEEIEKPGKKITRVVMNIKGKVSIYLKVKHSWGATYYFIDEIGQELRSINQQYFNLMTNLNTYGD